MDLSIGSNTLETLPGMITPPLPIYTSPIKLSNSQINSSFTSTPKRGNFNRKSKSILTLPNYEKKQGNCKKVTFKFTNTNKSSSNGSINKLHLWLSYRLVKLFHEKYRTNKIKLMKHNIIVPLKNNLGDLI